MRFFLSRFLLSIAIAAGLTPAAAAQQVEKAANAADAPERYSYHADGRRDPFVNLLNRGAEPAPMSRSGEGLSGLLFADITVRGILESRQALVAMVAGPDNKTYVVHQGDRLQDATIKAVTREGIVAVQRVTDPAAVVKQREVTKLLRTLEDAR